MTEKHNGDGESSHLSTPQINLKVCEQGLPSAQTTSLSQSQLLIHKTRPSWQFAVRRRRMEVVGG